MISGVHSDDMTESQRLTELAVILARGVLRLRQLRKLRDVCAPESAAESVSRPLDLCPETRLSVTGG